MKLIFLSFILVHQAWSGWYSSLEFLQEGIEAARAHPLSASNGAIMSYDHVTGSGVIVDENWVASAAHVLSEEFRQPGKQALPDCYSFRHNDGERVRFNCLTESYCFPEQDLVFLRVKRSFSKKNIASILPPHMYEDLVSSYKLPGANAPRSNLGHPATFFGCGHKIVADYLEGKTLAEVEAVQLHNSSVNRFSIGHNFGEEAVGHCFLSQYFPQNPKWKENPTEAFYSWTSYKEPSSVPLLSSSLPGDSGGGMFIEKEGAPYLAGITSWGHVGHHWDAGDQRVGTRFVTFYSSNPSQERENYLGRALNNF